MNKVLKTCGVALLALGLWATASVASTVRVEVDGSEYFIETLIGSFEDNQSLLGAQPWWGDQGTASRFAYQVGDSLGFPRSIEEFVLLGRFFAFSRDEDLVETMVFDEFGVERIGRGQNHYLTFATASPVPLPASVLLLLTGLVATVGLRFRRKEIGA